jgi:hypothetical protein
LLVLRGCRSGETGRRPQLAGGRQGRRHAPKARALEKVEKVSTDPGYLADFGGLVAVKRRTGVAVAPLRSLHPSVGGVEPILSGLGSGMSWGV